MKRTEIKKIWNILTDFTHTYGQEEDVINIIKKYMNLSFKKDKYGNYFITIGESKSLFISHLDNKVGQKLKVNKVIEIIDEEEFVKTDGFTILGADDKTGVVIMLNMIDNNVPGTYYFFIGEEPGLIGSSLYYKDKSNAFENFDRCIAFDRRSYGSIISRQKGSQCCSDEFVKALSNEFNNNGMYFEEDPYGVGSDSASFMSLIPECTNLSVGYFNEHTYRETQNIDYMIDMCETVIDIEWESLPTVRIPKSYDTATPKVVRKQENHLPIYKLNNIFSDITRLLRSKLKTISSNRGSFEPNKEMKFIQVKDLENINDFSVWVMWDGTIKINSKGKELIYDNYDELSKVLNKHNRKVRKLFGIEKLPHEIKEDEERELRKIKLEEEKKIKEEKEKEEKLIERIITNFEKFNKN